MNKNLLSVAVGSAALLVTSASLAVPFNSFDPKSMAMGGAGVAVANPATAPFFNPALLSVTDKDDDFALELPIIGVRVFDPDDFVDAVDDFDDTVMDDLDAALNVYNADPLNLDNIAPVTTAIDTMNNEIVTISDKPFEFEGGAGVVIGIPGEKFGMALSFSGNANISGIFEYRDADTVQSLSADMTVLANCLTTLNADDCNQDLLTYVDVTTDSNDPTINFTTDNQLESQVHVIGIVMTEVGLSFSREMAMFGTEVAIGITPKLVSVTIIDYKADADTADTGDIDGDDFSVDYDEFNLDVGIAIDHKNGWRSGFVIKNLIGQDYDAKNIVTDPVTLARTEVATGTVVSIKPQARVGVSHTNSWSTVALDVDLTANEGLGLAAEDSRYVALGIEFNALDWAQLRLGYRADTMNSDRNVVSAGFGISPFGVHIDLGVAGNENEVGASFQLGFRF